MSSEQIRPVIDCFCQILSLYGFTPITSETFRLAKFDQNEATIPLWKLIYEMINFDSNKIQKNSSEQIFSQVKKDKIVDKIKHDLCKRGYTYENFLSLDSRMEKGSRQLLVCVGWLICQMKFIDKCMKMFLKAISKNNEDENRNDNLIEEIKMALYSNCQARSRLRTMQKKNVQTNESFSPFENQIRQHPNLITQYISELNTEYKNLCLFLFWNKNENRFWKWMESVLDQPANSIESDDVSIGVNHQNLEAERERFHAALDTLDDALIRLEQLWISNSDHRSIEQDVSKVITSIDTHISQLFNQLLNANPLLI